MRGLGTLEKTKGNKTISWNQRKTCAWETSNAFEEERYSRASKDGKKHGPGVKGKITEMSKKHAKLKTLEQIEK
jgi:hypothetical protein